MYMTLYNDILTIISQYSGFPIRYEKNKLKINLDNNCESCNKRMRRTNKSVIETYAFPKLWEIDDEFLSESGKYIRSVNTLIKHNKSYIPYDVAFDMGLISYSSLSSYYPYSYRSEQMNDHLYGYKVRKHNNVKIYVKKPPSLSIMYRALKNILGLNEEDFLKKMKEYDREGLDENIMNRCIKQININDIPVKMAVRLCSKCRKKVRKGYIFI